MKKNGLVVNKKAVKAAKLVQHVNKNLLYGAHIIEYKTHQQREALDMVLRQGKSVNLMNAVNAFISIQKHNERNKYNKLKVLINIACIYVFGLDEIYHDSSYMNDPVIKFLVEDLQKFFTAR